MAEGRGEVDDDDGELEAKLTSHEGGKVATLEESGESGRGGRQRRGLAVLVRSDRKRWEKNGLVWWGFKGRKKEGMRG